MAQHDREPGGLPAPFRPAVAPGQWSGVAILDYKEDAAAPFKAITRQVLFAEPALACELRYFEIDAGGHSTLERHDHVHAVLVYRGAGQCLVGQDVRDIATGDLVSVPSLTWHQFRANRGEPLGFLCMVNAHRDKPQLPSPEELSKIASSPAIAQFLAS